MDVILSLCLGLGLAAACGFRIFVPPLILGLAARSGHLDLAGSFDWMATDAALIGFGLATALEIASYYVPWVDNLLDTIATPAAVVAGIVVAASVTTDVSPMLQWGFAAIGGGATAAAVQSATVAGRQLSLVTTGGVANPLVSTAESAGAVGLSALSVFLPVLAALLVVGLLFWAARKIFFRKPRQVAA